MNIPKSISNFLYIHKGYLDNGEWDTLFSLANHEHISIFELTKLLVNADINFKFSNKYQTGKLINIFETIPIDKLMEIADNILDVESRYGGYEPTVIEGDFYISVTFTFLDNETKYMSLEDFCIKLYRDIIMSLQSNYTFDYDFLFDNRIDGHNDPLIKDIMLGNPINLPKEPAWKSIEDLY